MTALAMPPRDIIQSLWIGARLSMMEQLCIHSFLAHGHPFHLYVDGAVQGIPAGTVVRDVREILPDTPIIRYRSGFGKGSPSLYSNLFRVELLHRRGSWWVDLDVVALRPFVAPEEVVLGLAQPQRGPQRLVPGVMRLPPQSALTARWREALSRIDLATTQWGEVGPRLMRRLAAELGLERFMLPPSTFYPVDAHRFWDLLRPGRLSSEAMGVHLWQNLWRDYGVDPDRRYPPGSPYEQLLGRFHPEAAAFRPKANVSAVLLRSIPKRVMRALAR